MKLFGAASLAFLGLSSLATTVTALAPSTLATSNGQAACLELSQQLGSTKVATLPINPSYVLSTTYYYSQQQAANKPSCVVAPTENSDVQTAMKTIRQHNSTFAVKAGGHNTNNYWSSTAGGVLIDFKNMMDKTYDAASSTGFYQPGNRWVDLYKYYEQYGKTVVGGRIGEIGSGLAIGGGLSFLSAEYGLACDSFEALDVVLADGSLVHATKDNEYSDLMLAIKGGGNQFGIVVGYTVDVHPIGDCWGGLVIYGPDQIESVFQAVLDFTNTNTDTKAAVIGTLEVIGLPSITNAFGQALGTTALDNINTFILLFNVYDGPDGSAVFQPFTDIPHLFDTRKQQSYYDIETMVEIGGYSSGSVSYRAGSHHSTASTSSATLKEALNNFMDYAQGPATGTFDILSFDMQPVPAALVQQSRARGGNAQDSVDGPYYWINYLHSSVPGTPGVQASLAEMKTMVEKTPNDADLPIFLNDANADQPILQSYNAYDKLKAAKAKYDPTNFLATNTGGPRFT